MFTIAFKLFKSTNSCKKVVNIQTVAVIQYTQVDGATKDDPKQMKKENIMSDELWNQRDVHNFYRANQPAIFDRHKMYWVSFKRNEDNSKEQVFTINMFDFEKPKLKK